MPAGCLSRTVGLPPVFPVSASTLKMMQPEDHRGGVISGDNGNRVTGSVLRRTVSEAEMCSKRVAIKKTASVEHLGSLIQDEEEDNGSGSGAFEEIWSTIQKKTEDVVEQGRRRPLSRPTDVWGSILSEKKEGDGVEKDVMSCDDVAPAPYVHPLVKRSSSLSERSLEICTESLGSETGSDGCCFGSFLESEKNDAVVAAVATAEEEKQPRQLEVGPMVDFPVGVGATRSKRVTAAAGEGSSRALPPPLPSLGHRGDGSNVQMRCHRQDGRLVVEAVPVPSRNCFRSQRHDGRLLLTFSGKETEENHEFEEEEEEIEEGGMVEDDQEDDDDDEEVDDELSVENEKEIVGLTMEKGRMKMNYVHHKFLCLTRWNMTMPTTAPWPHRLNRVVVPTLEADENGGGHVAKSLSYSKAAAAATLNPYVYSWRNKEEQQQQPAGGGAKVAEANENEKKGGVGFVRGCNGGGQQQPRRSAALLWDRHCIATS